jgi:hypothetical protein
MTTSQATHALSRRTALAGISATGLGLALAATTHHASAQDATPTSMAGHPMVGTWIVDPERDNTADVPSLIVFTPDGTIIDPVAGFAGSWQATGPRTGVFTLSGIDAGSGSYLVIRGTFEVDEATDTMSGPYSVTIVGADGTVLATTQGTNQLTRLPAQSGDAGTPLAGFPAWTPATPTPGTPTS